MIPPRQISHKDRQRAPRNMLLGRPSSRYQAVHPEDTDPPQPCGSAGSLEAQPWDSYLFGVFDFSGQGTNTTFSHSSGGGGGTRTLTGTLTCSLIQGVWSLFKTTAPALASHRTFLKHLVHFVQRKQVLESMDSRVRLSVGTLASPLTLGKHLSLTVPQFRCL